MNRHGAHGGTALLCASALAFALAGCVTPGGGDDDNPFARARRGQAQITIHVRNLNFSEARLTALGGGRRVRLGTVGGSGDETFRLEWNFTDRLAIEIDLVPGSSCTTRSMYVSPGDEIELQIASSLHLTQLCQR